MNVEAIEGDCIHQPEVKFDDLVRTHGGESDCLERIQWSRT